MGNGINHVCSMERAGYFDLSLRRWLQNPQKILSPYVREGMSVLDFGCGPGFFTIDLARLVGATGRVIAADLQEGMLDRLSRKIAGTELQSRITLHKCAVETSEWSEKVDFALACYVVHELPDQDRFFKELWAVLNTGGQVLVIEPPFHVSRSDFEKTLRKGRDAGLILAERPSVFFGMTALLRKG